MVVPVDALLIPKKATALLRFHGTSELSRIEMHGSSVFQRLRFAPSRLRRVQPPSTFKLMSSMAMAAVPRPKPPFFSLVRLPYARQLQTSRRSTLLGCVVQAISVWITEGG